MKRKKNTQIRRSREDEIISTAQTPESKLLWPSRSPRGLQVRRGSRHRRRLRLRRRRDVS